MIIDFHTKNCIIIIRRRPFHSWKSITWLEVFEGKRSFRKLSYYCKETSGKVYGYIDVRFQLVR